jgi:3-hydroxyisobutyrate dehydrogenase-like beta-hydroxyacid dehydrogenase
MTKKIGFIGLGIMGEGMVNCLLKDAVAGTPDTPLVIWNRTASKCQDLQTSFPDKTIEIKSSAKDVVADCDIVFSMLSTPEASAAVFNDENGTLAGVSRDSVIVDCATLAESDMKRMNEQITAKGGKFLEAPVSGSKGPAHAGQLIFLCAGNKTVFEDDTVQNALNAMGKASHYFGEEVGKATRAKLVVNSLMGTMMAAFGESLVLAESLDLDASKMLEVISQGAIATPMYALKGPKMLQKDHAPNFPLCHAHKDMKLAVDAARSVGVEYSVTQVAEELFRKAREDEELNVANEDFSAVFEQIHKESKKYS